MSFPTHSVPAWTYLPSSLSLDSFICVQEGKGRAILLFGAVTNSPQSSHDLVHTNRSMNGGYNTVCEADIVSWIVKGDTEALVSYSPRVNLYRRAQSQTAQFRNAQA